MINLNFFKKYSSFLLILLLLIAAGTALFIFKQQPNQAENYLAQVIHHTKSLLLASLENSLTIANQEPSSDAVSAATGQPLSQMAPSPQAATPPNLGSIHYVIKNGPPSQKLDILFIPQRISDMSAIDPVLKQIFLDNRPGERKGLLLTPPFDKYQNRFNIAYLDKNIDEQFFGCWLAPVAGSSTLYSGHGCNEALIQSVYQKFEPDFIVILFNLPGCLSSSGQIMQLNFNESEITGVFIHELGHLFGLADEYGGYYGVVDLHCGNILYPLCYEKYIKGLLVIPNIDQLGCPKWCQSFDQNKLKNMNAACAKNTTKDSCLQGGPCNWLEFKHPFFGTNCIGYDPAPTPFTQLSEWAVGINCIDNVQCSWQADYGFLAFKPNVSDSIMETLAITAGFNFPSLQHLDKVLQCCYPQQNTATCNSFLDPLKNPPPETGILTDALRKIGYCGSTPPPKPVSCGGMCNDSSECASGLICVLDTTNVPPGVTPNKYCHDPACPNKQDCYCVDLITVKTSGPNVTIDFVNPSAKANDWIGLYKAGASDQSYITWDWLSGTQTQGGVIKSGTVSFKNITSGNYEARYFIRNDQLSWPWQQIETKSFSVGPFIIDASSSNSIITATFSNPAATVDDWIGLYKVGNKDNQSYTDWKWLNNSQIKGNIVTQGAVTFKGVAAGNYEIRYLAKNSNNAWPWSSIDSKIVTVVPLIGAPITDVTSFGSLIDVKFDNPSAKASDWIGLYKAGASDQSIVSWRWTNNTQVQGNTIVSGIVTFENVTSGNYEIRYFVSDTSFSWPWRRIDNKKVSVSY